MAIIDTAAPQQNIAINGAMDFFQRNEGNTVTVNTATGTSGYVADMFQYQSGGSTVKNYSLQRSTDIPTVAQSGFQSSYSSLFTMVTGISSFAASDLVIPFTYNMEGLEFQKIHQKTVTFGFWAKASVIGTYNFALVNWAANRSYTTTFSISSASTWQFVPITIALDTVGTWVFTNAGSLQAFIGAYAGSTFQTSSLNQWNSTNTFVASTSTNWMATSGATFQIAQFSIVEGAYAMGGGTSFARAGKTIQQELALCQRYYTKTFPLGTAPAQNAGVTGAVGYRSPVANGSFGLNWIYPVTMRAVPTIVSYSPNAASANWSTNGGATPVYALDLSSQNCAVVAGNSSSVVNNGYEIHLTADAGL